MRNYQAEQEMLTISKQIWDMFETNVRFPKIESKQGGHTGCYYPQEHAIRFRWNSWNKMDIVGKRLLAIHELYHAAGFDHNSEDYFNGSFDLLSIEIYKRIFGYQEAHFLQWEHYMSEKAKEILKNNKS